MIRYQSEQKKMMSSGCQVYHIGQNGEDDVGCSRVGHHLGHPRRQEANDDHNNEMWQHRQQRQLLAHPSGETGHFGGIWHGEPAAYHSKSFKCIQTSGDGRYWNWLGLLVPRRRISPHGSFCWRYSQSSMALLDLGRVSSVDEEAKHQKFSLSGMMNSIKMTIKTGTESPIFLSNNQRESA